MGYALATSQYSGAQGISSATSSTTLTDGTAAFAVNGFRNFLAQSTSGGFPTRGAVSSNTATVITVASWDNGTPDSNKPYVVSNLQQVIGDLFHVGFSNGSQFYGYMLEPTQAKDGGFRERSDLTAKQSLIQYSSPNIIDRDFVYNPRVSQGDFSGGMGQVVGIDFSKFWDSTLDVRTPGYLASWPGWNTINVQGTLVSPLAAEVVSIGGKLWVTYGESNFHVYDVVPPSTITTHTGDIIAKSIDTDGYYLYLTNGTKIEQRVATSFATNVVVTTAATVTAVQIWSIQQGSNGRWLYYSDQAFPQSSLYRVDLNGGLPSAGAQVPLGTNVLSIVDLVPYQNGVAILTVGGTGAAAEQNWDLWFFDGANTTLLFHHDAYTGFGVCNCQGDLYVSENPSIGTYGKTQLVKVSNGGASVVASLGTPPNYLNLASVGPPRAVGSFVYFTTTAAAVKSIASQYCVVYNVLTGAFFHTIDPSPMPTGFRTMASEGEAVALALINGAIGQIQYQASGGFGAGGSAGSLVGAAGAVTNAAATSVAPPFGQATTAGNTLVLCGAATAGGGAATKSFTISGATGWILAARAFTGVGLSSEIWYKPNCAAGEVTPTLNCSNATSLTAQLSEWSGILKAAPLDQTGGIAVPIGNPAAVTVTTGGAIAATGEVAVTSFAETKGAAGTGAWTPGATWTNLGNDLAINRPLKFASDYLINPASGATLSELGSSSMVGPGRTWAAVIATFLPSNPITFASGGQLVTSRLDFNTPGIEKRFRRLELIHAPIPVNCSLQIDCYLDQDPAAFTPGLVPDATVTNSNVGALATDFFLANLLGHSAYFVLTFFSSDNAATVTANWFSVEIATPLAWEMNLACTAVRQNLRRDLDSQGVKGKDLADFWRDAWENPRRLTMFLRDGFAYTVALESFERWNPSPQKPQDTQVQDEEYIVKVVLRQSIADS